MIYAKKSCFQIAFLAAGAEWNKLSDKSKWEKLAAEDKARYEREMAQYKR